MLIFLNGKFVDSKDAVVSVFDHGVLYGDGVFEGIRAYNGYVFKLKEHIDRLYDSMKALKLTVKYSKEEMMQIVKDSCRLNALDNAYIRLVVTRGYGDLGLSPNNCKEATVFCIAATIQLYPKEHYEMGLKVITSSRRRNSAAAIDPQIKSLNYLNNIFAKMEASEYGAGEALMLNNEGYVLECTGDNIYIIKDNVLMTPPTYLGILGGITRAAVLEIAKNIGMEIKEVPFTLFNLYAADECFLTGTAAEIVPVREADARVIGNGKRGEWTYKLQEKFKEYVALKENGEKI